MSSWLGVAKRHLATACVMLTVVVAASFAALLLLTWLSLQLPSATIVARIDTAFQRGALTERDFRIGDSTMGYTQYEDCLILLMLSLRGGAVLPEVVSPTIIFSQWFDTDDHRGEFPTECQILRRAVAGTLSEPLKKAEFRYNRYLHGNRIIAALLLQLFELEQLRRVLKGALYLILSVALIGGLWQAKRSWPPASADASGGAAAALGIAVICAVLMGFYGLPYFGQSIALAPDDFVVFLFLLVSLRLRWLTMSVGRFYAYVVLYGCLVSWFELLTGGIPFGLAALITVLTLQIGRTTTPTEYLLRLTGAAGAYLASIAASLAAKLSVAGAVFGSTVWPQFFEQLAYRMDGGHNPGDSGSLVQVFDKLLASSWGIGHGSVRVGTALIVGSVPVFVLASLYAYWRSCDRMMLLRIAGMATSVLVIVMWFAVFRSHGILHSDWMVRTLVWAIAAAAVSLVWASTAAWQDVGLRKDATKTIC